MKDEIVYAAVLDMTDKAKIKETGIYGRIPMRIIRDEEADEYVVNTWCELCETFRRFYSVKSEDETIYECGGCGHRFTEEELFRGALRNWGFIVGIWDEAEGEEGDDE
jgi:ribosomal protein L37AE/L43A